MLDQIGNGRRIVRATVSADLMAELMRVGWRIPAGNIQAIECIQGVPPDAKFVGSMPSPADLSVWFFFEHESFDVVPEGGVIPIVQIVHRRIMADE